MGNYWRVLSRGKERFQSNPWWKHPELWLNSSWHQITSTQSTQNWKNIENQYSSSRLKTMACLLLKKHTKWSGCMPESPAQTWASLFLTHWPRTIPFSWFLRWPHQLKNLGQHIQSPSSSPTRKISSKEMTIPFPSFLSSKASPWRLLNLSLSDTADTCPRVGIGSWWLNWVKKKSVDYLKASQRFASGSHISESPVVALSSLVREELNEFRSTEFKSTGSQQFWKTAERACLHFSLRLKPIYLNFNQRQL